jgi:hypothetical protein
MHSTAGLLSGDDEEPVAIPFMLSAVDQEEASI